MLYFFLCIGPGTPQAADSRRTGQRGAVLSSAGQHVFGPELPQSEPLEHTADAGSQGCAGAGSHRLRPHRDGADTNEPA